ncbi:hypothetical protein [Neorhizobium tunisiense]|uniref:hypothetical protein n=1 Tax=Neorhizobium tunisiense TaxID=3144793 RepID=UPI0031F719E7
MAFRRENDPSENPLTAACVKQKDRAFRKAVQHALPISPGLDEAALAKVLQMGGGEGHRKAHQARQTLDESATGSGAQRKSSQD